MGDSMSPTVPPISTIITSTSREAERIRALISSVIGRYHDAVRPSGQTGAPVTCWMSGFPWISERGFPGRRVEA